MSNTQVQPRFLISHTSVQGGAFSLSPLSVAHSLAGSISKNVFLQYNRERTEMFVMTLDQDLVLKQNSFDYMVMPSVVFRVSLYAFITNSLFNERENTVVEEQKTCFSTVAKELLRCRVGQ